jgi:hypothetical protein
VARENGGVCISDEVYMYKHTIQYTID